MLLGSMAVSGCYYVQATRGQLDVMSRREPIDQVLVDPGTPDALARKLQLVQQAREFSIDELGMPDNGSYRSYAHLERDYVVWNVFAAPEFSLKARRWCYPVAGCVSYRGYFKEAKANELASRLKTDGFDVYVGGVSAYSTLGRFDDPVLSSMLRWDDIQLISVLFHELAHQLLYVKDDTGFNESFASAVEEFSVERFLAARGSGDLFEKYTESKQFRRRLMDLVATARADLRELYSGQTAEGDKRLMKAQRISELEAEIREEFEHSGRNADGWLQEPLNNARLLSMSLYEGRLDAFRALLNSCNNDLQCFYAEARWIAGFGSVNRDAYLDALATR
jgi:predicted aminopeptidase